MLMKAATLPTRSVRPAKLNWDGLMASVKENFARNLARLLRERKIKGRQLAEALGVGDSTVSGWLSERIAPQLDRLDAIAAFFGVTYLDLLKDHEEPMPAAAAPRDIDAILRELAATRGYDLRPKKP